MVNRGGRHGAQTLGPFLQVVGLDLSDRVVEGEVEGSFFREQLARMLHAISARVRSGTSRQMTLKPLGGKTGDLFESSGFGKEMGGAWHDGELLGTAKQG